MGPEPLPVELLQDTETLAEAEAEAEQAIDLGEEEVEVANALVDYMD